MSAAAHRRGWCPGALRPMESGDGLIVRLRITGGQLSPDRAHRLAQWAQDFGNGLIGLSARGNLQLRGVTPERLAQLQAQLKLYGLLDADPAGEAVRNIMASPLAGLDPSALVDIRPQLHKLDQTLKSDRTLHRLPPKFLFLIDDGGRLPLPIDRADIAFVARSAGDAAWCAVYLGGRLAGGCTIDDLCETAVGLARTFLDLRGDGEAAPRRMADLVSRIGTTAFARAAGLADMSKDARDPGHAAHHVLGFHDLGSARGLGLGIAFGRLEAELLHRLADEVEAAGGELRLSPWRAIFLIAKHIESRLAARLGDTGFILDDAAPLRAVTACPGKPACMHAATASWADAARLAPYARRFAANGIALHVSACSKGCAHPLRAPVTLVGRDSGYDLILDGKPGDAPAWRGLEMSSVERLLTRLAAHASAERAGSFDQRTSEAPS